MVPFVGARAVRAGEKGTPSSLTTVILIRHAEKDSGADPGLTENGRRRAKELVRVLDRAEIKAIYIGKPKRTKLTAQPLFESLKLSELLMSPDAPDKLAKEVRGKFSGQTVLIVGQAPTIPGILEAFGVGIDGPIGYDSMFIIQIPSDGKARLLRLKYGETDR